jgi:SPP1 family holin
MKNEKWIRRFYVILIAFFTVRILQSIRFRIVKIEERKFYMTVERGTIIRTVLLIMAIANQILVACGKSPLPFDSERVEWFVTSAFTFITMVMAWWKNNSFTAEAIRADKYMNTLKGKRSFDEEEDLEI